MTATPLALDRDQFLAEYWQKKPLLIPSALANFIPPVSPDELAGLAMEEGIESRIVDYRDTQWLLHQGPFVAQDFTRDTPWTLLVQAVDHYMPEVAALRQLFAFIPQWRMDDVMVSYAVDGGSVGPHFDNYDVFLLQGTGQRLWRVGQQCDDDTPLIPHEDLRILANFQCSEEYLLGPGDMLYLPPGVAHWGIAQGECSTFSIGFRAPRINDMLSRWTDTALDLLPADRFYADAGRQTAARPGEILEDDINRARQQLRDAVETLDVAGWFGELVTEPRYSVEPPADAEGELHLLAQPDKSLNLLPEAKLAWQEEPGHLTAYANGDAAQFSTTVLSALLVLCDTWHLQGDDLARAMESTESRQLLSFLLHSGAVYVE
ncbi:MAG: cupin domain-containing protein [Halieaceae bacterium]